MARRYDPDEIQSILDRKHSEGLTYAELSVETGIPIGTLSGWQRRHGGETDAFTEIAFPDDDVSELEVIGPLGHRVLVGPEMDDSLLRRVLAALPC